MEFPERLKEFCNRVKNLRSKIKTEEATKTSLIMPFFSLLGYDVFNPLEFVPEYTADVGIKKGEKVDYAIVDKKQNPIILIEAKFCGENLEKHGGQLFRYFATTSAKFGILTNGIVYKFYTDLEELNKMDKSPFLVVNLLSLKDNVIPYLQRFEKSSFNVMAVTAKANELRYNDQIKQFLSKQFSTPDDSFIAYVMSDIYKGRKTQRVIEDFRPLVKGAFTQLISDKANEKLKSAMTTEEIGLAPKANEVPAPVEPKDSSPSIERLESFFTIKALIHDSLNGQSLTYEDSKNQFEISLSRHWLCRINYDEMCVYINLKSGDKDGIRRRIRSIDDVHFYKNLLCQAVQGILQVQGAES
ncbi:MAG: type I restriction enzyme HsdR N-terminal domain-containing protein [Selenomonadaceae bacterium]|nr:type I restriction enzyme HsdR N-terminal domain-containing protein [Selenomonadaceae bacterium]